MEERPDEPSILITEYLEMKGPEMHEAFIVESTFNKTSSKYEAKEEQREIQETLQQYERLAGDTLSFSPANCSWADVHEELRKAQEAADASKLRTKGVFTKNRRKLSRIALIITPALNALPSKLNFLNGGLAVIFHLAYHREKNRQSLLDAFEDIPEIIAMAHNKSKKFPADKELCDSIESLRATLLHTIPNLVDLLRPGTFLGKTRSPFRAYDIEQLLALVHRQASRVEGCANSLSDDLIMKTYLGTEAVQKTATATRSQVERFDENISTVGRGVRDLNEQCEGIDCRILELTQSQQLIMQQLNDALSSQNGMFQMLKDAVLNRVYEEDSSLTMGRSRSPSRQASSAGKLTSIFNTLHVPHLQAVHDLATILRQSRGFDAAAKSHAAIVLRSDQFQRWISARESDLVHVDSHFDSSQLGKTSPISYFCAMLVQVLQGAAMNVPLHFFCGQHVAAVDDLKGPRGLIRSFLAQLVLEIRQNRPHDPLDAIDLTNFGGDDELMPTEEFCQVFRQLFWHIPDNVTVFCLIDDITRFERDSWSEDYALLMNMLSSIMADQGVRAKLKVLMTSPTRSRWLQDKLRPSQRIELRGGRTMGAGAERSLWEAARGAVWPGS